MNEFHKPVLILFLKISVPCILTTKYTKHKEVPHRFKNGSCMTPSFITPHPVESCGKAASIFKICRQSLHLPVKQAAGQIQQG